MTTGLVKLRSRSVCTICHDDVKDDRRLVRGDVRDEHGEPLERDSVGLVGGSVNCMSGRWWGRGARKADIMIIGEAPGWKEEERNSFFVGDSGRELDTWLRSAGMGKRAIWLDNVVRCRPATGDLGKDSTPRRNKLTANCVPYLAAEIARLKPSIIIPLGNVPLKHVLKVTGIQKWHGKIIPSREYNCWVVPLTHPSAIIRDKTFHRNTRTAFIVDVLKALQADHVDNPPKFSPIRWQFVDTPAQFDRMIDRLERAADTASDFETIGLDAREGKAISLGLSDGKIGYCVALMDHDGTRWAGNERKLWLRTDFRKILVAGDKIWRKGGFYHAEHPRRFERLLALLSSRENVQHNSGFDQQWGYRIGASPPELIHDTEVVDSILDKTTDNGLKDMALRRTDAGRYDDGLAEHLEKGATYDTIPVPVLTRYNALDSLYTAKIKQQQVREMKRHPAGKLCEVYNRVCVPIAMMERDGIRTDRGYAGGLKKLFSGRLVRKDRELKKILGVDNPGSDDQLFEAFYGVARKDYRTAVKNRQKIKMGDGALLSEDDVAGFRSWGVAKKVLESVRDNSSDRTSRKAARAILERRHLSKFVSTYLTMLSERDTIHPHYNLHVPVTGRPSMSNPNMLNWPRGPEVRNCWIARPGCVLVELDHSQQEMRIGAELSGDEAMLMVYDEDRDIHCFVGHHCIRRGGKKQPESKFLGGESRAKAKVVGFSVIYGKTEISLSEDLNCSVEEAAAMISLLKSEAFPGLGEWIRRQEDLVVMQGYVDTIFGRRLPVAGWDRPDRPGEYNGAKRKAVNYQIQSPAGDVTMIGLDRLHQRLVKENFPAPAGTMTPLRLTIYDSIIAEVPERHVDEYVDMAVEAMEAPIPEITRVKMKVGVKIGGRWGELKEQKR